MSADPLTDAQIAEGLTTNEWLAVNLMGWHKARLEGDCARMKWFWCSEPRRAVHLVDAWSPATDATTALRDVVPAMEARGWKKKEGNHFAGRQWYFLWIKDNNGKSAFAATFELALCRAAEKSLRSEAARAAESEPKNE